MGPSAYRDPYHIDVIRTALTRSLEERFPDMYKEIVHATETIIPLSEGMIYVDSGSRATLSFHS